MEVREDNQLGEHPGLRLVRTMKDCTEQMIKNELPLDSAALKWLIRHAQWMIDTYQKGSDGSTAEERLRQGMLHAFGEKISHLPHKTFGIA